MPQPEPALPLRDHCSVIYNHTLYVYSAEGFQSLRLADGAQWTRLPSGVSVNGATCVKAVPNGDETQAALYIVGGSTNASTVDYPGLQRFLFANQSWASVTPSDRVTQNRRNHGAVYLNSSSAILTYAGSQDTPEAEPSSQTFLLSIIPPYMVTSFSSKAPPLVRPQLLQWNESHAAMMGGSSDNKQIFTFSQEQGWADTGLTLEEPLPDDSKARSIIVAKDGGASALRTFDMSTSPNTVRRSMLRTSNDTKSAPQEGPRDDQGQQQPADDSARPPPAKRRKRQEAESEPEQANADAAPTPTIIRNGFALSDSPDGLVVISGGSAQEPLAIFNARTDGWVNASQFLGAGSSSPTSSSDPSASNSAGASSSSSGAAPSSTESGGASAPTPDEGRDKGLTILGATLGSIFGVAVFVVLIFVFLRWRRRKQSYMDGRNGKGARGGAGGEKDRLSFADRGASFMSQAGGAQGHGYTDSSSSTAIMLGQPRRGPEVIMRPGVIPEPGMRPPERALVPITPATTETAAFGLHRQRSSGWSRYFLGNTATDLTDSSSASAAASPARGQADPLVAPERPLRPSAGQAINFSRSYPSQRLTPRAAEEVDAAATAAATSPNDDVPTSSSSGSIQRFESSSSKGSSRSRSDALASGVPPGAHEDSSWSPVAREEWSSGRAPSSVYTDSAHGSGLPRDFNPALFPQVPRDSTATVFPGGSGAIIVGVDGVAGGGSGSGSGSGSGGGTDDARERGTATGIAMTEYDPQRRNSGMSWLNLGDGKDKNGGGGDGGRGGNNA